MTPALDPSASLHQLFTGDLSLLQRFIDALPVHCFVKTPGNDMVLINQTGAQALGSTVQGVRGKPLATWLDAGQLAHVSQQDQQVLTQHHTVRFDETLWDAQSAQYRHNLTFKTPVFDAQGQARFLIGLVLDVTEQKTLENQTASELQLLELLATNAPLPELLAAYTQSFEANFSGVICSVLLMDPDGIHLRHGAAPKLPVAFCQAIDGVVIGPMVGSCGTAAFTRETVVVSDIATDPLWQDYRHLALAHGLQACWSVPILSTKGRVLGSFANYHREPRSPQAHELLALKRSAYLLGLSIEHHQIGQNLAQQETALRESEARYRTLVEWSPEAVAVHSLGMITYVNTACIKLLRADTAADLLGKHIGELLHPDDRERGLARARQALETGDSIPMTEERLLRLDGSTVSVEIQSTAIVYDGAPAVYVVAHDLSKRREDEETIHHLAFFDALTGLPNRRLMLDRLQQALASSQRKQLHGALLLLDLDNFKQLNDLQGHNVGDALLLQAARRLQACVRKSDSVGRVGGDEFMVLLDIGADSASHAAQYAETVAQKILKQLAEPYTLLGKPYASTCSIGAMVFMQGGDGRDSVVKMADAAMYQAKAAGRNMACFYDPAMQAQAVARAEFEDDMREGFERHEFTLFYQIQVDVQGCPTGAEALVRWRSAKRGMVSPLEFIPLAEENGMILPLGQYVLETACTQLVAWAQQPATAAWTVAVNVSARQFAQAGFVDDVTQALKKTSANPLLLKLELTESMLVKNVEAVIAKMNAIKALGVSFSLDDFGTGYSSLSYLKLLPLAQLKIDQSFVRDLLTDPNDAVIARTVVALGHSLGMRVIAEGVETAAQRDLLASMDCDAFQGYYFGRPVPPEELFTAARCGGSLAAPAGNCCETG
ncbi:MAG: EAL domain-containing protein [Rhodoferax sp.]|uniref:sensor domain-containing protein n=1 Tax=Rhodoferax sp. TaxID=50421 RepID=UPI0026095B9B|nr:EAL domain-containing protein [Rhodoferax sp.]MDD2879417.1 EAL domain-containing protein [Rhodoferax sp.]